ncbi:MAG: hypothetical protein F6K09_34990, partial [Merismopedia sp. SIO2A8]|nr:hypothetical protein [Merismopedia sp. SIO2A8]
SVGRSPVAVAIGDLDGDGQANDLVVANATSDNISILIQDSSGSFSQSTISVGRSPRSVAIGDIDGDGQADDIVVANAISNNISILTQDNPGSFSQSTISVGRSPVAVAIGDLDGDGQTDDLAVANAASDSVSILIQDNSDGFSQSTVRVGHYPQSVAIGDIDGDGRADDVVVANRDSSSVSVLIECFLMGTHLLTNQGDIRVEDLAIGDRVQTADGTLESIKWVGRQTCHPSQVENPLRGYPIHIKSGALGNGLPHRDLYVSPDHALLFEGLLINAGALVNGISIVKTQPTKAFTYYHIELHKHALLVAEGTAAESYLPQSENRLAYENRIEYAQRYPRNDILCYWPMAYPRVSSKRQLPRYISKQLNSIASKLDFIEKVA